MTNSGEASLCDEKWKGCNDEGDYEVEPKRDSFLADPVEEAK
jgi:hypothetical protein